MPDAASPEIADPPHADFTTTHGPAAPLNRIATALTILAGTAILANCLLTSPPRFSEAHQQDTSLLRPVVSALGLWGLFPTERGVEIRNLIFYLAASLLTFAAGFHLLRNGLAGDKSLDDLLDVRRHAADPCFWWIILLLVSAVSSLYSHAQSMSFAAMTIRVFHAAWWMPLAALLSNHAARNLSRTLLLALSITAMLGVWYYVVRVYPVTPTARLNYPMGNELWLAACLLPGLFIAVGLLPNSPVAPATHDRRPWPHFAQIILCVLSACVILIALWLTRSRSAVMGLAAGMIVMAALVTTGLVRRIILLAAVLAALGGALVLRQTWLDSAGASRSDSIRSRLHYEWPYALHLFTQKPVAGHGEGGYAMLAGRIAREDQLEDPSLMRFDEWSWIAHAHNEYLELLADLGLVGLLAYLAALGVTFWRAVRFIDRSRAWQKSERRLAIALSAALVAMAIEQITDPAIREPGLPPIFLTVWALLWAVVRKVSPLVSPITIPHDLSSRRQGRAYGVFLCTAAAILGYFGMQDWLGARARHECAVLMEAREFEAASAQADFAASALLDPFQRAQARMLAVWARSLLFDRRLTESDSPRKEWLDDSDEALRRLISLEHDVPRFLRTSRLAADLHLNRARAFARLGSKDAESFSQQQFISALMQNQRDEPFLPDRVVALWRSLPQASSLDRLTWLRYLLRAGEIPSEVLELVRELPARADFGATLNDLHAVAQRDAGRTAPPWQDLLSPETLRISALAKSLAGRPQESIPLVAAAQQMYAKVGARLFAARAASIHEEVRYRLAVNPAADAQENLARLTQAAQLHGVSADASTDLTHELGWTRLVVLIASGDESSARNQADRIGGPLSAEQKLARAYLEVAVLHNARFGAQTEAMAFAENAARLDPTLAQAWLLLLERNLERDDLAKASHAARQFINIAPDADAARRYLSRYRERFPAAAIWTELVVPMSSTTSRPATQPTRPTSD